MWVLVASARGLPEQEDYSNCILEINVVIIRRPSALMVKGRRAAAASTFSRHK